MDHGMLREKIKKILLIISATIVLLGIVNIIITATQTRGAGVAIALFGGLVELCAYASIPAGIYAILVGQDMLMKHQGVPMPTPQPRPQYTPQQQYRAPQQPYGGQNVQQQYGGQPQQYAQAPQQPQFNGQQQYGAPQAPQGQQGQPPYPPQ